MTTAMHEMSTAAHQISNARLYQAARITGARASYMEFQKKEMAVTRLAMLPLVRRDHTHNLNGSIRSRHISAQNDRTVLSTQRHSALLVIYTVTQ